MRNTADTTSGLNSVHFKLFAEMSYTVCFYRCRGLHQTRKINRRVISSDTYPRNSVAGMVLSCVLHCTYRQQPCGCTLGRHSLNLLEITGLSGNTLLHQFIHVHRYLWQS